MLRRLVLVRRLEVDVVEPNEAPCGIMETSLYLSTQSKKLECHLGVARRTTGHLIVTGNAILTTFFITQTYHRRPWSRMKL